MQAPGRVRKNSDTTTRKKQEFSTKRRTLCIAAFLSLHLAAWSEMKRFIWSELRANLIVPCFDSSVEAEGCIDFPKRLPAPGESDPLASGNSLAAVMEFIDSERAACWVHRSFKHHPINETAAQNQSGDSCVHCFVCGPLVIWIMCSLPASWQPGGVWRRCRCRTGSEPGETANRALRSHPERTSVGDKAG